MLRTLLLLLASVSAHRRLLDDYGQDPTTFYSDGNAAEDEPSTTTRIIGPIPNTDYGGDAQKDRYPYFAGLWRNSQN